MLYLKHLEQDPARNRCPVQVCGMKNDKRGLRAKPRVCAAQRGPRTPGEAYKRRPCEAEPRRMSRRTKRKEEAGVCSRENGSCKGPEVE